MKFILLTTLFSSALLLSCGQKSTRTIENEVKSDTLDFKTENTAKGDVNSSDSLPFDEEIQDFEDYYVLIVDTNKNYETLRQKMEQISSKHQISIDSMGRFYNTKKNLIALPDTDEDEIYAGEYYPRRFPSTYLSLEYLDFYQNKAGKKTIALVAGIYETKKSVDSALTHILPHAKKSYVRKANIYTGCVH